MHILNENVGQDIVSNFMVAQALMPQTEPTYSKDPTLSTTNIYKVCFSIIYQIPSSTKSEISLQNQEAPILQLVHSVQILVEPCVTKATNEMNLGLL